MTDIEYWSPRGVGFDHVPHMVTGADATGRPNISGFVKGKDGGERVVAMFGGPKFARLDFRSFEPNYVQVKVGVDKGQEDVLERLMAACSDALLTRKKIQWAINPAENRDGEPTAVRIARLEHTKSYASVAKRVQQIYDDYDIASGRHQLNRLSVEATHTEYPTQLWLSGMMMDRILQETQSYSEEKFWYWFCARNRLLDDRAPAQVFPEDPEKVVAAAKAHFKPKEEKI